MFVGSLRDIHSPYAIWRAGGQHLGGIDHVAVTEKPNGATGNCLDKTCIFYWLCFTFKKAVEPIASQST